MNEIKEVSVRWSDGYLEEFEVSEVRAGCDLLWMVLVNGQNRHIPLRTVRWFSITDKPMPLKSYSNAKSSPGHADHQNTTNVNESSKSMAGTPLFRAIDDFVNHGTTDIKDIVSRLESYRGRAVNGATQM